MSDSPTSQHIPTAILRSETEIPEGAVLLEAQATSEYTQLHEFLQESINKDLVEQANRLAETAKSLLTLQLAIPSVFAIMLKLLEGSKATLAHTDYFAVALILGAFLSWVMALGFTLFALRPDPYQVNPLVVSREVEGESEKQQALSLLEFYQQSAARKFHRIGISSGLTLLGILLMVFHIVIF